MVATAIYGKVQLLTRTGLDWSRRYPRTIEALRSLPVKSAYLDGELCALRPDGVPTFSRLQVAMDEGRTDDLVFIVFDLLYLNGKSMTVLPLIERKERLRALFARAIPGLRFSDRVVGNGPRFHQEACRLGVEGVVSKRIDQSWLARQITEAFPWDTAPRFLLRDRDTSYGQIFRDRVQAMAIEQVVTAPRSPWQNAYVERIIGSIRRECLDHVVVFDERHLRRVLSAYFRYHHRSRTHLSLDKDCPEPRPIQPPSAGTVVAFPQVGGLHHRYERRAA
jgi:hypothetical protein